VWERINLYSEVAAIGASLALAPVLLATVPEEWLRLLLMAAISTAVVVAVTLLTRPTPRAARVGFYRRVDPPGFWRRTALEAGADPARPVAALRRGLRVTAAASVSVYALLVGCGRLLLPAPGTSALPSLLLIGIGIAAMPFWWGAVAGAGETGP
jgi:hypothetical protein